MQNIEQYKKLHSDDKSYGASSLKFIDEISVFIDHLKPKTVLDYGCGKGALIKGLKEKYPEVDFLGYDPAIPGKDVLPQGPFDLVINTDVLEHIPEQELPEVIATIASLSDCVYFNLHHVLAKTVLPNGENAHCTVKPPQWYHELFKRFFKEVVPLKGRRPYLSVVLTFDIPSHVVAAYMRVLNRVSRRPWWRRMLRKLVGKND